MQTFPDQRESDIRHINPEEMVVLDFNAFVHEAGIRDEREEFHLYVADTHGNTLEVTRGMWRLLWKRFFQQQDLRDLEQTQADSLV